MSILNGIKEDVYMTAERMISVVEEGAALIMGTTEDTTGNEPFEHSDKDIFDDGWEAEADNIDNPLNGITESVLGDIMKNQAAPQSMWDNINAFQSAIDWKEPFILGIVAFHMVMILSTIYVTRTGGLGSRVTLLVIMGAVVRFGEKLNSYGADTWEEFATQNYFDKNGIFFTIVVSAPLLLIAFVMLILYLREAGVLLVAVKKQELKQKKRNAAAKTKKKKKKSVKKE